MDGDLQNDPRDIPRLLEEIERGADIVSGWRRERQDLLLLRKIPSWIANWIIRGATGVPIHDQGCSLKAYRREVIEGLDLYADMHRFIALLTMPMGTSIAEIQVRHHPRVAGTSKYGLGRVFRVLTDLVTIQMLTRFRESPIRWFALLGTPFLLGTLLAGLAAFWSWGDSIGVLHPLRAVRRGGRRRGRFRPRHPRRLPRMGSGGLSDRGVPQVSVLVPVSDSPQPVGDIHREILPELEKITPEYELLYLVGTPETRSAFAFCSALAEPTRRSCSPPASIALEGRSCSRFLATSRPTPAQSRPSTRRSRTGRTWPLDPDRPGPGARRRASNPGCSIDWFRG
jgi:hypothetical protein